MRGYYCKQKGCQKWDSAPGAPRPAPFSPPGTKRGAGGRAALPHF